MKFKPHKELKRIWRLFKLQQDLDWENELYEEKDRLNGAKGYQEGCFDYDLEVISRRITSIEKAIIKIQNL